MREFDSCEVLAMFNKESIEKIDFKNVIDWNIINVSVEFPCRLD